MVVLIRIFIWETCFDISKCPNGTIESFNGRKSWRKKMKLVNKNKWQVCFDNAVLYFRMD